MLQGPGAPETMAVLTRLLQQRHNYYRSLLVIEVLVLISLSSLQQTPDWWG